MVSDTDTAWMVVKTSKFSQKTITGSQSIFQGLIPIGLAIGEGIDIYIIRLAGNWHNIMAFDRTIKPISPIIDWQYTRAYVRWNTLRNDLSLLDAYYQYSGCVVYAFYAFFKLILLSEQGNITNASVYCGQGTYVL